MATLLLLAASYAAYKRMNEEKEEDDPEAQAELLKNLVPVPLLPVERELELLRAPIVTVSFLQGSVEQAARHLERRVAEIIRLNPFLAGMLAKDPADKELKLFYDAKGNQDREDVFEVIQSSTVQSSTPCEVEVVESSRIPLSQSSTSYEEMSNILELSGVVDWSNKSLFKVLLIPDAEEPHDKYALVVSLSHVVGDIHTYYQLLQMMDIGAEPRRLDPVRQTTAYLKAVEEALGTKEARYLADAVRSPLVDLFQKSDDPAGVKMFYLNEEVLVHQGEETGCEFRKDSIDATNALVSSLFFPMNEASFGLIFMNMRNRIEGSIGRDNAGNYIKALVLREEDYATPTLLQQGISTLRRCKTFEKDLPPFLWTMSASLCGSWAHSMDSIQLEPDQPSVLKHLPVWDISALSSTLPNRLSMWITFTVEPRQKGRTDGKLGAFVLCRESVWEKIKDLGLVESVIAETAKSENDST